MLLALLLAISASTVTHFWTLDMATPTEQDVLHSGVWSISEDYVPKFCLGVSEMVCSSFPYEEMYPQLNQAIIEPKTF